MDWPTVHSAQNTLNNNLHLSEIIISSIVTIIVVMVMVILCLGDRLVFAKMNRAFISPMVRPNLPLRRPASGPGMVSPTYTFPQPTEQVCYQTPEQPISEVKGIFYYPACWIWIYLDTSGGTCFYKISAFFSKCQCNLVTRKLKPGSIFHYYYIQSSQSKASIYSR